MINLSREFYNVHQIFDVTEVLTRLIFSFFLKTAVHSLIYEQIGNLNVRNLILVTNVFWSSFGKAIRIKK